MIAAYYTDKLILRQSRFFALVFVDYQNDWSSLKKKQKKCYGKKDMQEKELTGYPSIDKPWFKYYTDDQINANMVDPRTSAEGIKGYINEVKSKVVVVLDAVFEKTLMAMQGTCAEFAVILSAADSCAFI